MNALSTLRLGRTDLRGLRAWFAALAFALAAASTLGLIHRGLHGLPEMPRRATDTAQAPSPHAFGLAALFGVHDGGQCRLYDQLSHGPAALAAPLDLPAFALPAAPCAPQAAEAPPPPGAPFDARGPPSFR